VKLALEGWGTVEDQQMARPQTAKKSVFVRCESPG